MTRPWAVLAIGLGWIPFLTLYRWYDPVLTVRPVVFSAQPQIIPCNRIDVSSTEEPSQCVIMRFDDAVEMVRQIHDLCVENGQSDCGERP